MSSRLLILWQCVFHKLSRRKQCQADKSKAKANRHDVAGDGSQWFPRGTELPTQSPLFWVQNKDRYLRQLLIGDIEAQTGRELLAYFTECDRTHAQIDQTDDIYLSELLSDRRSENIDLLIETNGGMTDATEKVCAVLRNSGVDLRVIVPRRAKSNGTVVAFCGRAIVMGNDSELGPIDPTIMVQGNPIPCDYIVKAQNVNDQILIQMAKSAIRQTRKLAKQLLETGMLEGAPDATLEDLLNKLASRDTYHSHGSVIDATESSRLGLKVDHLQPADPLWRKMWLLRTMYSFDCRQRGYAKLFEARRISSPIVIAP
jgi:ATP-dependent protease ClpP protease subunit